MDAARRIDLSRIPIAERKAVLFIDTASGLSQWGRFEQAYQALRFADELAPEEVRTHGAVRQLVMDMAGRAPRSIQTKAREFAQHVGVEL